MLLAGMLCTLLLLVQNNFWRHGFLDCGQERSTLGKGRLQLFTQNTLVTNILGEHLGPRSCWDLEIFCCPLNREETKQIAPVHCVHGYRFKESILNETTAK